MRDRIRQYIRKVDVFAFRVASLNVIGYCISVGIPTAVDPLLKSHVKYGARNYLLGYWIFLLSVVVFCLSYRVNASKRSTVYKKTYWTFLFLLIPTWATLPNFFPEFPHPFILVYPIVFAIFTAFTVFAHNSEMKSDFIKDISIDRLAKIERIKIEHEGWFRTLIGFFSVHPVVAISTVVFIHRHTNTVTTDISEVFVLNAALILAVVATFIPLLAGVVVETIRKMYRIRDQLIAIQK